MVLTSNALLKHLNGLYRPSTASEIGAHFGISGISASRHLAKLEHIGQAMRMMHGTKVVWIGNDEIAQKLAMAFPVLITFYKARNPAHSKFLQEEWDDLLSFGFGNLRRESRPRKGEAT